MAWDPGQYLKFAGPRLRPAIDLLNRVELDAPDTVFDLGAGAGNVTRLLVERWPGARVTGVDSSQPMLDQAAAAVPGAAWVRAELENWQPDQPAALLYSNAALQWLDGHATLFPRLMGLLAPGGVLAVQMPRNFAAPSHALITKAARSGPWRDRLEPLLRPAPTAEPGVYYDLLAPHAAALDIWETEYTQPLRGDNPVKEWTKGTWLKPLLDALDEPERSAFEECYGALVREAYPPRPDGVTLYPFRRLFMVATRA